MSTPPFQRLPVVVRGLVLLVGLGLPLYWGLTYSGLYRWLAEVQLSLFDSYYVMLTGLVSVVVVLGGLVLPLSLVAGRLGESPPEHEAAQRSTEDWIVANPGLFTLILVCVGCLGMTAYFHIRAAAMGDLETVTLESLESGAEPPSEWINVEGYPQWNAAMSVRDDRSSERFYVPLQSRLARGPSLLLELRRMDPSEDRQVWTGTLNTPPGVILSAVDEMRGPGAQGVVRILEVDSSPEKIASFGNVFGGVSGVFLVLLGIMWARRRRRGA